LPLLVWKPESIGKDLSRSSVRLGPRTAPTRQEESKQTKETTANTCSIAAAVGAAAVIECTGGLARVRSRGHSARGRSAATAGYASIRACVGGWRWWTRVTNADIRTGIIGVRGAWHLRASVGAARAAEHDLSKLKHTLRAGLVRCLHRDGLHTLTVCRIRHLGHDLEGSAGLGPGNLVTTFVTNSLFKLHRHVCALCNLGVHTRHARNAATGSSLERVGGAARCWLAYTNVRKCRQYRGGDHKAGEQTTQETGLKHVWNGEEVTFHTEECIFSVCARCEFSKTPEVAMHAWLAFGVRA
jgi:hypothetical protein